MKIRYVVLLASMMAPLAAHAAEYVGERNVSNLFHGQGTYRDDDGAVYTGQWVDGMREGQGVMTWANGDRYEGAFEQDMRHGQGTLTKKDGTRVSGQWFNDVLEGQVNVAYGNGKMEVGKVESLLFDVPSSRLVDRSVNLAPAPAKRLADRGEAPSATVADVMRTLQENPPAAGRSDATALQVKADAMPRFSLDAKVKEVIGNAVGHVLYAVRAAQSLELHVESPALGVQVSLSGYEGPGEYQADAIKVQYTDATMPVAGSNVPPAKVEVTFDDGKLIKGTLRFTALRKTDSGEVPEVRSAEFVLPVR